MSGFGASRRFDITYSLAVEPARRFVAAQTTSRLDG